MHCVAKEGMNRAEKYALRRNNLVKNIGPKNRQPQGGASGRRREWRQSHSDYSSVPSGHWQRWQPHRLRRRPSLKAKIIGSGEPSVDAALTRIAYGRLVVGVIYVPRGAHRNGKKGEMGSAWSGVHRHTKSDSWNAEWRVERNCRNCFARSAAIRIGRKSARHSEVLRLVPRTCR